MSTTSDGPVLGIIPARAGSKGVPGKNREIIGGRPLIDYTTSALRASRSVSGILITTDDEFILDYYSEDQDLQLRRRPARLATDTASSADAVADALANWPGELPSTIVLAQPTTPLRLASDVDRALEVFRTLRLDSLVSVCRVEGMRHPMDMYRRDSEGGGQPYLEAGVGVHRRDSYEELYQRNGALYVVTTEYFQATGRLRSERPFLFEMPWERSINIDTHGDMAIARALVESGFVEVPS